MIDMLRQMYIFAKTVDHGSFRAAAKSLRLSPSVVSHHVGQLEQQLGAPLLHRSTRKLSLTPDGERLLAAAHTMIEAAETGVQDITNQVHNVSGVLRLTVPAVLSQSELMDQLVNFTHANPQVKLVLEFSDVRHDLIADGYDVAIRAGDMKDSSLKSRKLFDIERRLIASPSYIDSKPEPITPNDLADWDWIELEPVWKKKQIFKKSGQSQVLSNLKSRIRVNNACALPNLTRSGAGLAAVPEFIAAPYIHRGELTYVLQDWVLDPISVFAVWPANAPRDGLIGHFVDFLGSTKAQKGGSDH